MHGAGARGRLERSEIARNGKDNILISHGASVEVLACRIHGGKESGINVFGDTQARIEGSEIFSNAESGVYVSDMGDPLLLGNTIRDHSLGQFFYCGAAVFVSGDAAGGATVRAGNVFARNELGDVVRA